MAPSRGLPHSYRLVSRAFSPLRPSMRMPASPGPVSASRNFSYDGLVESTHLLLTNVHNASGLPWYTILPLTALSVRMLVAFPTSIIAARNRQERAKVIPELLEARPQLEREVLLKHNDKGPAVCTRYLHLALSKKRKELENARGVSRWPAFLPWLQLFPFLLIIDVIRRMTGQTKGLLGWLFGADAASSRTSPDDVESWSRNAMSETSRSFSGSGENPGDGRDNASHVSSADLTVMPVADANATAMSDTGHSLLEPSLGDEGCLWFTNLLVADPQLYLPLLLSATLFVNVSMEEAKVDARLTPGSRAPRWSRALTKTLKLTSLAMFPFTMHLPAAMLWYWLSSALMGVAQKEALDYIVPRTEPAQPMQPKDPGLSSQASQRETRKPYKPLRRAKRK